MARQCVAASRCRHASAQWPRPGVHAQPRFSPCASHSHMLIRMTYVALSFRITCQSSVMSYGSVLTVVRMNNELAYDWTVENPTRSSQRMERHYRFRRTRGMHATGDAQSIGAVAVLVSPLLRANESSEFRALSRVDAHGSARQLAQLVAFTSREWVSPAGVRLAMHVQAMGATA
jgi:hypothetical protein